MGGSKGMKQSGEKRHFYRMTRKTALGNITILCDEQGLTGLHFESSSDTGMAEEKEQKTLLLQDAFKQLDEYLAGLRTVFDLPFSVRGTAFQLKVWQALRDIPYGTSISYGELAVRIGRPSAARAIGAANSRNPLPVFIPCHRVVGADGSLVGYLGGLARKKQLLELESVR